EQDGSHDGSGQEEIADAHARYDNVPRGRPIAESRLSQPFPDALDRWSQDQGLVMGGPQPMMHVPASQASRAPAWGLQANYRQSGASSQAQQPIRGAPYQMADRPPGWGSERDSKPHGAGVYGQAQASGPPAHLADAYSGWDGPRASQAQTAEDYRRAPANLAPPQADFWQGQDARRKLDNPSNGKAEGPPQHQGIGRAPIGLPPTAPPTISSGDSVTESVVTSALHSGSIASSSSA
ncbi:hypothetical protein WJX84_005348, partial [Apatococcus fuscideae]